MQNHTVRLSPVERDPEVFLAAHAKVVAALAVPEAELATRAAAAATPAVADTEGSQTEGPPCSANFLGGAIFSVGDIPLGVILNRFFACRETASALASASTEEGAKWAGPIRAQLPATVADLGLPQLCTWYQRLLTRKSFVEGV